MSAKALLHAIQSLPDEATVPVGWVRAKIGAGERVEVDLTVEEFAALINRAPSTVRGFIGDVDGAYKFRGREWRIPHDAAQRYLDTLRDRNGAH